MNPKSMGAGIPIPALPSTNPPASSGAACAHAILPEDILPLRLKTVAQLVDVSEKTVRRWIQRGILSSYKLGGARVVRKRDLRAFLDQQSGEIRKVQS